MDEWLHCYLSSFVYHGSVTDFLAKREEKFKASNYQAVERWGMGFWRGDYFFAQLIHIRHNRIM